MDPRNVRKERPPRGAKKKGSKDPGASCKGCATPRTFGLEGYRSMMDQEDLSFICVAFYVLKKFKLELLNPDAQLITLFPDNLGSMKRLLRRGLGSLFLLLLLNFLGFMEFLYAP